VAPPTNRGHFCVGAGVSPVLASPPLATVVAQFEMDVSRTRDCCVAKNATLRAARLDPSRREKRLFRMTIKLSHCSRYR
jgi:hypothetical protein